MPEEVYFSLKHSQKLQKEPNKQNLFWFLFYNTAKKSRDFTPLTTLYY